MNRMIRTMAALVACAGLAVAGVPVAAAGPNEGPGNGGGQSGQCTGPQDDRPASCTSQGGPGDQGGN
jgi:hypothetical protein